MSIKDFQNRQVLVSGALKRIDYGLIAKMAGVSEASLLYTLKQTGMAIEVAMRK